MAFHRRNYIEHFGKYFMDFIKHIIFLLKLKACKLSVFSEKTEVLCKLLYINGIEKDAF